MQNNKLQSILTLLITGVFVILLFPKLQNPNNLQLQILQLGWKGILLDIIILALQMLFPFVPFALLAGMNVLLFGWFWGFLLTLLASVTGSAFGFWLSRSLGREWAKSKLVRFGKWTSLPDNRNFALIMLARLIPILPGAAVNYAAGLSQMRFSVFLTASIIGKIPMIAWESWIGHDFWQFLNHPLRFFLALLIGGVFIGIALLIWRRSAPGEGDGTV